MLLDVVVPGKPQPKGRPRVVRRGGFTRAITPDSTIAWEHHAEMRMRSAWVGREPLDEAVAVEVLAVFARPASKPKHIDAVTWKAGGRVAYFGRADVDNVAKCCLDALQLAFVVVNDTRVVRLVAEKWYAAVGEQEHVRVKLDRMGGGHA